MGSVAVEGERFTRIRLQHEHRSVAAVFCVVVVVLAFSWWFQFLGEEEVGRRLVLVVAVAGQCQLESTTTIGLGQQHRETPDFVAM